MRVCVRERDFLLLFTWYMDEAIILDLSSPLILAFEIITEKKGYLDLALGCISNRKEMQKLVMVADFFFLVIRGCRLYHIHRIL